MGDVVQKDQLVASLSDIQLKGKVLIVESIAANAKNRAKLIVSNQVIKSTCQRLLPVSFHILLQFPEEVDEVELKKGVIEGKVPGVDYLEGLFEEVRVLSLCLLVFLRHMRILYEFSQVLKGESFVSLQKGGNILC